MTNLKKTIASITLSCIAIGTTLGSISHFTAFADSNNTFVLEAYSYYKSGDGAGHSWIAITNNTNNPRVVSVYGDLNPNETVTIGIWGNLNDNGVWYNAENYAIHQLNYYNGRVSVSMNITATQLDSISAYISNHDYWNASYNCSCFVKDIWNLVSNDKLNCGWMVNLPAWLCDSIKGKDVYYTNKSIAENSRIGYHANYQFNYYIPNISGSSSSSSRETNTISLFESSFIETSLQENISTQLKMVGSNLTVEEYIELSGLEV